MGYVTDSMTNPDKVFQCGSTIDGVYNPTGVDYHLPSHNKSQYGYRSGPLSKGDWEAIGRLDRRSLNHTNYPEVLEALDVISDDVNGPVPLNKRKAFIVNERVFTHTKRYPKAFTYSGEYRINLNGIFHPYFSQGAFAVTGFRSGFLPTKPTDDDLKGIAGQMIRSIRPTAPDFRLARFLGELRDAHKMFSPNSYFLRPSGKKPGRPAVPLKESVPSFYLKERGALVGSAYLNYQFAVKPTWNDIQRAAQAVIDSAQTVEQFVRDSANEVHRSSTRRLGDNSVSFDGSGWTTIAPFTLVNNPKGQVLVSGNPGASNSNVAKPSINSYASYRSQIRSFSTFRYYMGDPHGFLGRLESYVGEAERVVGLQGDLKTLYDLTPFSWLLDWHVDISGLLGYQQDVADYSLVAQRAGWVYEVNAWGSAALVPYGASDNLHRNLRMTGVQSNIEYKYSYRKAGSPYDMDLSGWSTYGPFQWSILAAMGLSILHIPNKKTG